MKKKFLTLVVMLLIAALLLPGCASLEDIVGQITPGDESSNQVSGQVTPNDNKEDNQEDASADKAEDSDTSISFGRMEGGVYTNRYAGFTCELDSNWQFYTADELQELPEDVKDLFDGTEAGEILDKYQYIMDMQAENAADLLSINVIYQKQDLATRLQYAAMSEEAIIDATLSQKDMMISSYAQAGIDVSKMEKKTVTFLGQSRTAIHTTATLQGVDYYILQLFDFDSGAYSITLTLASFVDDTTDSLLSLFKATA